MKKTPLSKKEVLIYILWSIVFVCGIIFLIVYHVNDMQLYVGDKSCGFKYLFHLYCPGCGGTRAVDALLHGQLLKSFMYHPLVLYIVIFFFSYYIPATLRCLHILKWKPNDMAYVNMLGLMLVIIVSFFIIRIISVALFHYDYIGECVGYWQ